jgi:hypothetical protein
MPGLLPFISLLAAFSFLTLIYLLRNEIASKMRRPVRVPIPVLTTEGERRLRAQAESQE